MNNPLSPVGELFSEAWRRYKASFQTATKIAFVLALLTQIFVVLPPDSFKNHPLFSFLYFVVGLIIIIWFGTTLTIALFYASEDEGRSEWHSYYDRAQPVWGRFFRTKLLQGILTIIGLILFVIPGIILLVKFAVADWVAVFEGLSARDSLKRSSAYVKGRWWGVVARGLLFFLTLIPAQLITNLTRFSNNPSVGELWIQAVASIVVVTLIAPWSAVFVNALYNDLRKTEGTTVVPVTPAV